jgi:hypothetical protein
MPKAPRIAARADAGAAVARADQDARGPRQDVRNHRDLATSSDGDDLKATVPIEVAGRRFERRRVVDA